ncbi:hypothetical protein IMSAGC020_02364 [Lachnospiraceae bacterium]|nr:hypothetical protein IMSAGC020_02364 [Lachnospiraceae bacterium]
MMPAFDIRSKRFLITTDPIVIDSDFVEVVQMLDANARKLLPYVTKI